MSDRLSSRGGRGLSGRRRATALLGAAALATVGLVGSSGPALAVNGADMQLDGDTDDDAGTPAYDWENFFQAGADGTGGDITDKGTLPTNFIARGHTADYGLPEYSTFATGSKDTLDVSGWQCGKSNNLGAKDDLVNVYVVAYREPTSKHLYLYFGAEKSSNLGDNNIGIWFLQDPDAGCTVPAKGTNTTWTGHHVNGDVLLTAAFTNGGTVATVESHVWKNGALGSANSGGVLCGGPNPETAVGAYACAITNDAANQPPNGDVNPPWNHPVKTPGANGSLAAQEFYEGGIDVTQAALNAGLSQEPCVSNFVADTRSSQSSTATLFDYASGSFPVCVPSTTMSNTAPTKDKSTVHGGENVTFTFYEKNDGRVSLSNPSVTTDKCATATSKLGSTNLGTTAWDDTQFNVGDLNGNGTLDPNEEWAFTCTTSFASGAKTGTINAVGHGYDGDTDVTYYPVGSPPADCTAGVVVNHKLCDLQERASATVTIVNPDTTLTTSASAVITYTFSEYNNGDSKLNNVSISTVSGQCDSAPAYQSGDTADVGWLNPGETWVYTCTKTLTGPTTDTGTASATATGTGTGTDTGTSSVIVTHCTGSQAPPSYKCSTSERDATTVTITNSARD